MQTFAAIERRKSDNEVISFGCSEAYPSLQAAAEAYAYELQGQTIMSDRYATEIWRLDLPVNGLTPDVPANVTAEARMLLDKLDEDQRQAELEAEDDAQHFGRMLRRYQREAV